MSFEYIAHRNNGIGLSVDSSHRPMTTTLIQPQGKRIMIVDSEESLRGLLEASFIQAGYEVIVARDGKEALGIFALERVDLVLMEAILPEMNGFDLCNELRKQSDVPIIFLTALNRPDDIAYGFALGADDYIPKPFIFREVEVRVEAILRRMAWIEETPVFRVISSGDITLDDDEQTVSVRGETVHLTPIEYQLLHYLMCLPDQPISKDELFKSVWGYDVSGGTNLVEVAVRRLREKIELTPSAPDYLVTVRGAGYKFNTQHSPQMHPMFV